MNLSGEFDNLDSPRRHPFLLIIILIAIIAIFIWLKTEQRDRIKTWIVPESTEQEKDKAEPELADSGIEKITLEKKTGTSSAQKKIFPSKPAYSTKDIEAAKELEAKGKLQEARIKYLDLLQTLSDPKLITECEKRLGNINIALLVSAMPMEEKVEYVVQRGDAIQKIAKKFGTTDDLIIAQNNLKTNDVLRVGDRLKVLKGTFSIEISKSRNELLLKLNNRFFKRYSVGTGKEGKTPIGKFVITNQKEKNPTWWKDNKAIPFGHPDNILGTRWMAIKAVGDTPDVKGYGIHGTWEDASIGKSESAGCIRMHNKDAEELFMLVPPGTEVTIYD